jgi:hypothetical protein
MKIRTDSMLCYSHRNPVFHSFLNRYTRNVRIHRADDDMDPELRLAMQMSMQADEPPRALVALPIVPAEPLEGEPGVLKLSVRSHQAAFVLSSFKRDFDVDVELWLNTEPALFSLFRLPLGSLAVCSFVSLTARAS